MWKAFARPAKQGTVAAKAKTDGRNVTGVALESGLKRHAREYMQGDHCSGVDNIATCHADLCYL